jgi:hypothetical protein
MSDWRLHIAFHYPHDRLALGWELHRPEENYQYYTIQVYILIVTVKLDFI